MLEKIRAIALEKFASEGEVEAFMEGFSKQASLDFGRLLSSNREAVSRAAIGLGAALLGAGVVKGVSSASSFATNFSLRNKFEASLNQVMANNKVVKGTRPEKVREYAETLFKFAPHAASDPNLLGYILAHIVLGEGIDLQTIKSWTDLEGRYIDNTRTSPLVGIKQQ